MITAHSSKHLRLQSCATITAPFRQRFGGVKEVIKKAIDIYGLRFRIGCDKAYGYIISDVTVVHRGLAGHSELIPELQVKGIDI